MQLLLLYYVYILYHFVGRRMLGLWCDVVPCRRNRSRFYDVIFITFFMLLRWFESNKYEPENHNAK